MTFEIVYRFRCDAPQCPAVALGSGDGKGTPEGWTAVSSTAHIRPQDFPRPPIRTLSGRTRQNKLTYETATTGRFRLHLCPEHPATFAEHTPITNGQGGGGKDGTIVNVACSCGSKFPWTRAAYLIGEPQPRYLPERAWWSHLPADLKWYATREAVTV